MRRPESRSHLCQCPAVLPAAVLKAPVPSPEKYATHTYYRSLVHGPWKMISIVLLKRFILNYVIHEGRSMHVENMYCGVQKRTLDPLEL